MNRLEQLGIQQWRLKASFQSDVVDESHGLVDEPAALAIDLMSDSPIEPLEVKTQESKPLPSDPEPNSLASMGWQDLQELIDHTRHCPSCGVNESLLGCGNLEADWMFVVDSPSSREIEAQELFVGRAGQLFDAVLSSVGLQRAEIYSSSVFKCAIGDDLSASPQCNEIVHRQISLLQPKVVVTFGEFSAQAVIRANESLDILRASPQQCFQSKVTIVPTYSPNQMLSDASLKSHVWQDLKRCLQVLAS